MIQQEFRGYLITASPLKQRSGKWAVSVIVERRQGDKKGKETFYADDNIHYILEIEAAEESINPGRNLIKSNSVGF